MADDRRKSVENMTEEEQKEFLRKTVEDNRRKMNIPRRRTDFDSLGVSTSIAAEIAPEKVPGKKVREKDRPVVDFANKTKETAIAKREQYQDKWPTLFELLGPMAGQKELSQYSYQADLYDATPKFVWSSVKRESGKYLPIIKRDFNHSGRSYHMKLTPAKLEEGDDVREYYPGAKEEFVEMVLVQMACERGLPMLGGLYGVKFSLYELRKRLKEAGHSYTIFQIKEALYIMNGSILEVRQEDGDGEVLVRESMFNALGLRTWSEWKELGRSSECFVRFNSLHVEAIKQKSYRLYNEKKALTMRDPLHRWLFKRMSREWVRADMLKAIQWRLSSMIRDSGSTNLKMRDQKINFSSALDLLVASGDIRKWKAHEELGGPRGTKILDVIFEITPSPEFVREMKRFNQLHRDSSPLKLPQ